MGLFDAFSFNGKRALVVGGATGMGAAVAEVVKDAGAEVVVMDRADIGLDGVKAIHLDLSEKASIDAAITLDQGPRGSKRGDPIGQRREHGTRTIQLPRVTEDASAHRHAVMLVVVRQELGLERRHVHRQRTLRLAGLALEAEVEHVVQPFVA